MRENLTLDEGLRQKGQVCSLILFVFDELPRFKTLLVLQLLLLLLSQILQRQNDLASDRCRQCWVLDDGLL